MKVILTISGLSVLACQSRNPRPTTPDAVDVIIPDAHRHRPRLTYCPEDFAQPDKRLKPEMVVGTSGQRLACLDLSFWPLLAMTVGADAGEFSMTWGDPKQPTPTYPDDERWMNWVPTLQELGFDPFPMPLGLPNGASARLTLPKGQIYSRNVVLDKERNYVQWKFPSASGLIKSVANEIVYTADRITEVTIATPDGVQVFYVNERSTRSLLLSISNDLETVPSDYNDPLQSLDHLKHLSELAKIHDGVFKPPVRYSPVRTARPICNQALFVYDTVSNMSAVAPESCCA